MNILINKTYFKYIIFLCFPWILLSTGGFVHVDMPIQGFLIFSIISVSIYYLSYSITKTTHFFDSNIYNYKTFLSSNLFLYSLIGILCVLMINTYALSSSYDFNLAFARTAIFNDDKGVEHVYGSLINRMLYTFMFLPIVFVSLLDVYKFKLQHYLIAIMYVLTGVLVGGRFALYHIFIIYLINSMFNKRKMYSFRNILIGLLFFGVSFLVLINRRLNTDNNVIDSIIESLSSLFLGIYNYHSIQLGVMSFYKEIPVMPLGPFTGISTPIGFLIQGGGTIEGEILTFLNSIVFVSPIGKIDGYNAFGTSIMYFLPIFGWTGILAFFVCFFFFIYLVSLEKDTRTRILFYKYLLFSFFFSAFSPMLFSFAWWFAILFILFKKKQNKNATKYSNSKL